MSSDGTSPFLASAASSAAFVRRMAGSIVSINLFVLGMVAFLLYQSFGEYEERAEMTAQNLSQMLAQDIGREFEKIDVTLLTAVDEIERQFAHGGIDRAALNDFLGRLQGHVPEVISLRTTDAAGIARYGVGVNPKARLNTAEREYFFLQRDNPDAGLIISNPVFARIEKRWVVPVSRAIHLPDGSFGGVVYSNVELEHLAKIFSSLDVGRRGSVSLRDAELRIFARYPVPREIDRVIGHKLAVPELQKMIQSGQDAGTYVSSHTVDGVERKFAVRRIDKLQLYAVVGRATDEYMAPWRAQAAKILALEALFILTTLVAAWQIIRSWKRQRAATLDLAREEEKFHTVVDFTFDWEYWEGPGGEVLYMSPSCERVTGYSRAEFQADPQLLARIVYSDDADLLAGHRHDVAHEDAATLDFRIVRKDGEVRWIAHACQSVFGRDGKFIGRRVSNRDITERKRTEDALRLSSERLQLATRVANIGIWDWDIPRNELLWDDSMYQLYGIRKGDFGGAYDAWINTIHPEDKAHTDGEIQAALRGEREYAPEFRIVRTDGTIRYIKADSRTIKDPEGKPLRMIGTNIDITEIKQAEMSIRTLNQELEQRVAERTAQLETAIYDLENFNYSASHDLRIPLRAVDGYSRILLDEYSGVLDAEGMRLLQVVRDNTKRMAQYIESMLTFSSIGRMMASPAEIDMDALAHEVTEELKAATAGRELEFKIDKLPSGFADKALMRRVMENLLANAIKFTRSKSSALIEVGAKAERGETVYYVRDNGVGFDMRYADKLFGVFQRLHGVEEFEGAGIGLAIVKRIMTKLGGRVWGEGKVGEGATIYFALPAGERS
jgi:PAS domain S-box-containing protein